MSAKPKTFVTQKDLMDVSDKKASREAILADTRKNVKSQTGLNKKFQINMIDAVNHVVDHGDIRIVRDVLAEIAEVRPHDVNSMKAYLEKYAPVQFKDVEKDGKVVETSVAFYNKTGTYDLNALCTEKWWLVAKPPVYKPFVFADELQKLINRAAKRAEDPKGDEDNVDMALLTAAKELLRTTSDEEQEIAA